MGKIERIIDRELGKFLKKHKTVNLEIEEIYHIPKEKLEKFMIDMMRLKENVKNCNFPDCDCDHNGYVKGCWDNKRGLDKEDAEYLDSFLTETREWL